MCGTTPGQVNNYGLNEISLSLSIHDETHCGIRFFMRITPWRTEHKYVVEGNGLISFRLVSNASQSLH